MVAEVHRNAEHVHGRVSVHDLSLLRMDLQVIDHKSSTTGGACIDMNDINNEMQLCAAQTNTWQFVSGTWNSGSYTSVVIRLVTDGNPNGPIWFDDVRLAPQ